MLEQQLGLPAAAGLAFALLEQQPEASPAAAGLAFAFAAASGHSFAPNLMQVAALEAHAAISQFAGLHSLVPHCDAVAAALTLLVLLQPDEQATAKRITAAKVSFNNCFISNSPIMGGRGLNERSTLLYLQ